MLSLLFIAMASAALLNSAAAAVGATSTNMQTFTSGADGLVFSGPANSKTGNSVVEIGDYNNDGIADFAVAASAINSGKGMTVIVLGQTGDWSDINMATVTSGATTRRILSTVTNDNSGSSLGGAGDVNGDGFADLLVAATSDEGGTTGTVYVIFGKAGPYTDLTLGDSLMVGNNGFAIYGAQQVDRLGYLNSNTRGLMGDVNGDGVDDFVISAYNYDYKSRSNSGAAWLIYGSKVTPTTNIELSALTNAVGVLIGGAKASDLTGYGLDGVGDFNDDGIVDFLIGAYQYGPVVGGVTRSGAGGAFLIYGARSMTEIDLNSFTTGSKGVLMLGAAESDGTGFAVSGAGDVNSDGIPDILVGARDATVGGQLRTGKAYVVYGSSVARTANIDFLTFTSGAAGFVINSGASFQYLGSSVSRAGDMNSDGVDDFMVGAPALAGGNMYVIYGSSVVRTTDVNLQSATDVYTFTNAGGNIVYGGLDVNGDGYPDVVLGNLNSQGGAAYMVLGPLPRAGTFTPTRKPSARPTAKPTAKPSALPTRTPSMAPSTAKPSRRPTLSPTYGPTHKPSAQPSRAPTKVPTTRPTGQPSSSPSCQPSGQPSTSPSARPSVAPSIQPSAQPTREPSGQPTAQPSGLPSSAPSVQPTVMPSSQPSAAPSAEPTAQPTSMPSTQPSVQPTSQPTGSAAPTAEAVIESGGSTSAPAMSDGGIAGVVVGGVVFLALLGMILALCFASVSANSTTVTTAAPAPATAAVTVDGAQYEMTSVEEVA